MIKEIEKTMTDFLSIYSSASLFLESGEGVNEVKILLWFEENETADLVIYTFNVRKKVSD